MKRPQWIVIAVAFLLTIGLYFLTEQNIFGSKKIAASTAGTLTHTDEVLSIDTILHHARENLSPIQLNKLAFLENSISRGDVADQKIHLNHQLALFWKDSAKLFEPYAWYTAEAARLENSEKSLTFAAHLFLNDLRSDSDPALRQWKALQARDLFERSLKLNPANDSSQVALGAAILYGGLANPMEGVQKIRTVADKDSTNIYAQLTLGEASLISGQVDKAIERFQKVVQQEPNNLQALLALADTYDRKGDKQQAVYYYKRCLPLMQIPGYKKEIEQRMAELSR